MEKLKLKMEDLPFLLGRLGELMKKKTLLGIILLLAVDISFSYPLAEAAVLHYYAGPDYYSPGTGFLLELTDFKVTGPSPPEVGDTVNVEFKLRNYGQSEIEFAELGVFAAVRDPDNKDCSFGFMYENKTFAVGETVVFNSSRKLDKPGTWKIWPSFQISLATGKKLGPEEWHVAVIEVEQLLYPDLIVEEVKCDWRNNSIGYVIKNDGEEEAKSGYYVALYMDGKEFDRDYVNISLNPGQTYESWFKQYRWPEGRDLNVTVCVDAGNSINESNESNNCLEALCKRQFEPIAITSGPSVVNVTEDSVLIVWTTNVASSSLVNYSSRSSGFTGSVYDPKPVKNHSILLTGLKSTTTYRYLVESVEWHGRIRSRTLIFETNPFADNEKPTIKLLLPERLRGVVEIKADASDNVGVAQVTFLIDGEVKFTDFSSPYSWTCDTTLYSNGIHNFRVVAVDYSFNTAFDVKEVTIENPPRDETPPAISILKPGNESEVLGMVEIETVIQDMGLMGETVGNIVKAEIYVDGFLVKRWAYSSLRYDIFKREFVPVSPTSRLELTYLWNTTGLAADSEHTIEVRGWDNSGNNGKASIRVRKVRVEWAPPPLEMKIINVELTREVVRYENWFDVYLTVKNTGNVALRHFVITDYCRGFQAIALPSPLTSQDTEVSYHPDMQVSEIRILPLMETLGVGESWIFHYYAVPILYNQYNLWDPDIPLNDYVFGWQNTWIDFEAEGHRHAVFIELPYAPLYMDADGNGIDDLDDALRCADYLIITCPVGLYSYNPSDREGVDILLQEAATLAKAKSGVLAYFKGGTLVEELKDLIRPGRAWASKLAPSFNHPDTMDAYILLIGEEPIVPSGFLDVWDREIEWASGGRQQSVRACDNVIADVVGDERPDLIVGRIIGDTARDLIRPIQASIDVYLGNGFDRQMATVVTGVEDKSLHMMEVAEDAASDLLSQGIPHVSTIHWSDFVKVRWHCHFTEYDAYTLGDIDGDGLDEVIIADDEESKIHIYDSWNGRLIREFACHFTRYDGFAAGDVDGDGVSEIIIANDEENLLYIYEADGTLKTSLQIVFNQWDQIATGNVMRTYEEVNNGQPARDDILIVHEDSDYVSIYTIQSEDGDISYQYESFSLEDFDLDFTPYDSFAVGNVRDDWEGNEIVIIRDDDEKIYVFRLSSTYFDITGLSCSEIRDLNRDRSKHVRYTPYDGFALGDVDGNGRDDIIVICDEDRTIYRYYWNGTDWCYAPSMYSRLMENWFEGVRGTGSSTRHDGFAVGKVISGENPKITLISHDERCFYILASTRNEADEWANQRLPLALSILAVTGHGNPSGPSPMGVDWKDLWFFPKHAFVFSFSCLTGYYVDNDNSFGEALFDSGAAVFIGSTEVSAIDTNLEALRSYFEYWDVWGVSAGRAFRDYERSVFSGDRYWKLWVFEYNYYGDPKFP